MAMPNVTGFEPHPENPKWIRLNFADGSQSPYAEDPDGSFRQTATQVAQSLAPQPAPMASMPTAQPAVMSFGMDPGAPAPAVMTTEMDPGRIAPVSAPPPGFAPIAPIDPSRRPDVVPAGPMVTQGNSFRPAQTLPGVGAAPTRQGGEAIAREAAGESRPDDPSYTQGPAPYRIVDVPATGGTSTSTTREVGGLAPEDRKKVDAANQAAVDAQHEADQAALRARTEQVNHEWSRLTEQEKAKLAEEAARKADEADLTTKVEAQTRKMEDLTSKPIDPSRAFQGDAGWYAFMAGFGDSIQNFGAALAGRGPVANPGATIDRMIERSVQMQTQEMEQQFKMGRITADKLDAERNYVRAQLATVGKQLAETQLAKARTEEESLGLQAMGKKFEADRKAAIAKNAAATANTQRTSTTKQTTPGTPGGASLFLGEKPDWDAVKAHSEKQAGADQVERGVSRLERAAGWTWDEKGNNGAGGYVGADGRPVTPNTADPSGVSLFGTRFSTGEGARELNGALEDIAAGGAKVKDPVGAVSDKSVEAEKNAMAAGTDEGVLRAAERTRRNLRGMKAGIDSGFSPGVTNASRYRRAAETEYRNNQPGLPRSRPATAADLRGNR